MKLTIQHDKTLFSPPIENGVQLEWERTGSPGKLTFTTIPSPNSHIEFVEGDRVCFYYGDKKVFMGYVFSKKRDKEHRIQVTCYDQIRYLKNKYSYVFENKSATQIIKALCNDFNLNVGNFANTGYNIPTVAEENTSGLDIILSVLEETLLNTGDMFVFYDDFGTLQLKNVLDMLSGVLIYDESAENFDYSSSIDDETYNEIILHYKHDDGKVYPYVASNSEKINQWGKLRFFEEVKNHTIAQNKANALLNLYARKTRGLKVTGAFGDVGVRGGTMIPVKLNLGDIVTNNFMIVEKVTHKFNKDQYTMDLTLEGAWEDETIKNDSTYVTPEIPVKVSSGGGGNTPPNDPPKTNDEPRAVGGERCSISVSITGDFDSRIQFPIATTFKLNGKSQTVNHSGKFSYSLTVDKGSTVVLQFTYPDTAEIVTTKGNWSMVANPTLTNAKTGDKIVIKRLV